jgi:hypothetical protein
MNGHTIWGAVADPTRRRLIELLRDGPRTTGELCRSFPVSRFAVMKHLKVLEAAGLIDARREGRCRWNHLNPAPLSTVQGHWAGVAEPEAPARPVKSAEKTPGHTAEVSFQLFLDAVPWRVFDAITINVSAWWGRPHLRSDDATNLVIEAQPGGRFFEEWGHRQGALRGVVTAIKQNERLELGGPIVDGAHQALLRFGLEPREGGTLLTARAEGIEACVLDDLVRRRLRAFVEEGIRSGVTS